MQGKKRKYILIIFIVIISITTFTGWNLFGPTVKSPENKFFYIPTGSTYNDVIKVLVEKNIIDNKFWFDKVATYLKFDKAVKPGKYKINDGASIVNLVRMLRSGNQSPVNLVITKLRTKEDLAKKLANNFECDSLSVISFLSNNDSLAKYDLDTNIVMTAIIANTYTLLWNNKPYNIFKKLFTEQQQFWNAKRKNQSAALHFTPTEIYILASIVEEETNKAEDKGKIASVYINRLHTGMRLAADPTVKFALKDFGLKRIYSIHTRIPSPYNTYLHAGLPPGPICTPSIKTIDAVLNAPSTNYLFFVANADFSGYSTFAVTYQEHLKNARAYQSALDSLMLLKQQNKN